MTHLKPAFEDPPQLLALSIARIIDLQSASFGDDLLSSKGSPRVSPSGSAPPLSYGLDFCSIGLIFVIEFGHGFTVDERH